MEPTQTVNKSSHHQQQQQQQQQQQGRGHPNALYMDAYTSTSIQSQRMAPSRTEAAPTSQSCSRSRRQRKAEVAPELRPPSSGDEAIPHPRMPNPESLRLHEQVSERFIHAQMLSAPNQFYTPPPTPPGMQHAYIASAHFWEASSTSQLLELATRTRLDQHLIPSLTRAYHLNHHPHPSYSPETSNRTRAPHAHTVNNPSDPTTHPYSAKTLNATSSVTGNQIVAASSGVCRSQPGTALPTEAGLLNRPSNNSVRQQQHPKSVQHAKKPSAREQNLSPAQHHHARESAIVSPNAAE